MEHFQQSSANSVKCALFKMEMYIHKNVYEYVRICCLSIYVLTHVHA